MHAMELSFWDSVAMALSFARQNDARYAGAFAKVASAKNGAVARVRDGPVRSLLSV